MACHWRLSDSKSPQVSRTLVTILAIPNNAVVWMVSPRPPTSKSSSPFNSPLATVLKTLITISIISPSCSIVVVFFNSQAMSMFLFFFSHSFSFILRSAGTAKLAILQILFFLRLIALVGKVFANGAGDLGSIPGRVVPKTFKIELDTILLNTQQYKICIKSGAIQG